MLTVLETGPDVLEPLAVLVGCGAVLEEPLLLTLDALPDEEPPQPASISAIAASAASRTPSAGRSRPARTCG
jgi:hypothetical protein